VATGCPPTIELRFDVTSVDRIRQEWRGCSTLELCRTLSGNGPMAWSIIDPGGHFHPLRAIQIPRSGPVALSTGAIRSVKTLAAVNTRLPDGRNISPVASTNKENRARSCEKTRTYHSVAFITNSHILRGNSENFSLITSLQTRHIFTSSALASALTAPLHQARFKRGRNSSSFLFLFSFLFYSL
jgi:hypothetical protein